MPTEASVSATDANNPSNSALKRCDVSVSSRTSSIVRTSSTGCSGSIAWTAPVAACASESGGTEVRSTIARLLQSRSRVYS